MDKAFEGNVILALCGGSDNRLIEVLLDLNPSAATIRSSLYGFLSHLNCLSTFGGSLSDSLRYNNTAD
jgi:hypothetical protein